MDYRLFFTNHASPTFVLIRVKKWMFMPEGITRHMGFWKAEEFQKLTFPASECMLEWKLLDEKYCV